MDWSFLDFSGLTERFAAYSLSINQHNALVATMVSVGTLYCFLGYRTLKVVLAITGFLLAGGIAALVAGRLGDENSALMVVCGVMGGLMGALLFSFLYKTGIFVLGLLSASLIAQNMLVSRPEAWIPLVIIGIGIAGGIVALKIERPVVTIATAALGAWIVVTGVAYFFVGATSVQQWGLSPELETEQSLVLACWATLTVAGVLAQFATRKRTVEPQPAN